MLPDQVVIIGAGNVGYHLGCRLYEKNVKIAQVFSRDMHKAADLAGQVDSAAVNVLHDLLPLDNCLYIFSVKDDAIEMVAGQLAHLAGPQRYFAHTSGAVSSEVLAKHFPQSGVFYPLQTFSRDRIPDFDHIPLCVYSGEARVLDSLLHIGRRISHQVQVIDDQQRRVLHVAAVFVNNFTNHFFGIGQELVEAEGLPFDLLRPLMAETVAKIMEHDPILMQSGPARRRDQGTILSHLRYLKRYPAYQDLYRLISHSIEIQTTKNKQQ